MIPNSSNCEGKALVRTTHHPNWLLFARTLANQLDSPRVLAYINTRLSSLRFSLQKDIINHKDILLISFLNNHVYLYTMNIYSDSSHSALKYLKDTEVNINNLLVMTGDFNIRDSLWDLSFFHHSSISNNLLIIADLFNLDLLIPTNLSSTRYSDTEDEANSVIDLIFLHNGSNELNNHLIHSDWYLSSNYAPLTISIPIAEENIIVSKMSIPKNSKQETANKLSWHHFKFILK